MPLTALELQTHVQNKHNKAWDVYRTYRRMYHGSVTIVPGSCLVHLLHPADDPAVDYVIGVDRLHILAASSNSYAILNFDPSVCFKTKKLANAFEQLLYKAGWDRYPPEKSKLRIRKKVK